MLAEGLRGIVERRRRPDRAPSSRRRRPGCTRARTSPASTPAPLDAWADLAPLEPCSTKIGPRRNPTSRRVDRASAPVARRVSLTLGGRPVLDGIDLAAAPRRGRRAARPVGLRQDLAAAADRRPASPRPRHVRVDGAPPVPGRAAAMVFQSYRLLPWKSVPRNVAFALPAPRPGRARGAGRPRARPGRARPLRRRLAARAFRRHAAARRARPGAGGRAGAVADGRALRRARRPVARADAGRAAAADRRRRRARPWSSSPTASTRR